MQLSVVKIETLEELVPTAQDINSGAYTITKQTRLRVTVNDLDANGSDDPLYTYEVPSQDTEFAALVVGDLITATTIVPEE